MAFIRNDRGREMLSLVEGLLESPPTVSSVCIASAATDRIDATVTVVQDS